MKFNICKERLKDVRDLRNLSQARLAGKAGIGKRQIQRIENSKEEKVSVHEETLIALAKHLSVDRDVLTGDQPIPEKVSNTNRSISEATKLADRKPPEIYETRLVKLDTGFAIVEFSKSNPVGNVIARDVLDEAAGLRLTSSYAMHNLLRAAFDALVDNYNGEEGTFETTEQYEDFLDSIAHQLSGPSRHLNTTTTETAHVENNTAPAEETSGSSEVES